MRYYHYFDIEFCEDKFGLNVSACFGTPMENPEDDTVEGEYWGIELLFAFIEIHIGVIIIP